MSRTAPGRVLVLGPLPPPVHGAAVVTQGMIEWLRRNGVRVSVVDSSVDSHGIATISGFRPVARYLLARLGKHAVCCVALLRRPDALYVGGAGDRGLYFQLICLTAARILRVPVVFHHHSSAYLAQRSRPMALVCRVTSDQSTHVVLSAQMQQQLRATYGVSNAEALSNTLFVRGESLPPRRAAGRPWVRLGHISNLSIDKGMRDISETVAVLEASGRDFELHIAGPVADRATQELVDGLQRGRENVVVHGPLGGAALVDFYDNLDLLLFPSRYRHEAAPMVVLEAASRSVPALAHPVGSLPELVCSAELIAPIGEFAGRADELVGAWPGAGDKLSERTHAEFIRQRSEAEARLRRLWIRYLPGWAVTGDQTQVRAEPRVTRAGWVPAAGQSTRRGSVEGSG